MDIPIPALILAVIGAFYLTKAVFSWITFLAETFMFKGMSVSLSSYYRSWLAMPGPRPDFLLSAESRTVEDVRREERKMGW